jgi:glycerol-3-phosphate acyltransferase PlsY
MDFDLLDIALILGAYLLGSIPFGLVFSKMFAKIDIREYGSHNIGATNVYRNLGKTLGVLTLLADIGKGFLPAWLAGALTGSEIMVSATALAAFLGHLYPVYLKFSGGKGVATAVGGYLVLAPGALLGAFVVFVLAMVAFRYVSVSSMAAALAVPLFMCLSPGSHSQAFLITAAIISALIVLRHKENIKRLVAGEESKVGKKKS